MMLVIAVILLDPVGFGGLRAWALATQTSGTFLTDDFELNKPHLNPEP